MSVTRVNSGKVTIEFRRVYSSDSGGEDALNRVLSALSRAGLENDENNDVVSIDRSRNHPHGDFFDITVRVAGL